MARVSILVNCFNGEKYVAEALASIASQTFQDYEVIFIDNCSTDRSVEIAKSFGDKIKIIQTPFNMPLCKARVFAREYLTGEFICVLDIDDLWMPTKLEKQVAVMRAHPEVGLIYTNTVFFDHLGHETNAYDSVMPSGRIFNQLLANYFISYETIMLRNSALKKYNLFFNERYNISSDMELLTKLSYFVDAFYIDEPLGKWRYGHTSESVTQFESFPREYELLLSDLEGMIDGFQTKFAVEIKSLNGIILNMKGIASWQKGIKAQARKYFARAVAINKKYLVPLIMVNFMTYDKYKDMRRLFKKT